VSVDPIIERALRELESLHADLTTVAGRFEAELSRVHSTHRQSALNLLHYVALRGRDLRELQDVLAALGLSSLGRAESHVMANVEAVLDMLHRRSDPSSPVSAGATKAFARGRALLEQHAATLLGPHRAGHDNRIMVTMPTEAAADPLLMLELVSAGMDCVRINCAHDGPGVWARMIEHLRAAERQTGRSCRIMFDVAGPKLRTGPIEPGPRVVKYRPKVDSYGRITAPARILLVPEGRTPPDAPSVDAVLPMPGDWVSRLEPGDRVSFQDLRGKARWMDVTKVRGACRVAVAIEGAYITPGTVLRSARQDPADASGVSAEARVGPLLPQEQHIPLRRGDRLLLTGEGAPGRPARYDRDGRLTSPAQVSCTLPAIFADVRPGERIWFDDGKIGGAIRSVSAEGIEIEITAARAHGEKLRADKGINLPDTTIHVPSLTPKDIDDLRFIALHGDLVGFSFVRSAGDVRALRELLTDCGRPDMGIVLKIETRAAFECLPELLLAAMEGSSAGVMIARGDLAVELGYERMAEVQEEILWMSQAAHLPVIWATQVLESLAKKGRPSRAEITDAAMGERAECVMLNKGPYIVEAVRTLDDILHRMEAHQRKKSSMMRRLNVAGSFLDRLHAR